jgi:hypothetical protein
MDHDDISVMAKKLPAPQVKDMGVCQKNCGIDYAKCLITKFDMATCLQEEAACALDCLKGVKVQKHPSVKYNLCSACKEAVTEVATLVSKATCTEAQSSITEVCDNFFGVSGTALTRECYFEFAEACPSIKKWVQDKAFDADLACLLMEMC